MNMNKLSTAKRAQIVGMMSEGNSLRAITRMVISVLTILPDGIAGASRE